MQDRNDETPDQPDNGVLTNEGAVDTTGIGIVGGMTATVDVDLPAMADEDDDVVEDDVVDDEPLAAEELADIAELEPTTDVVDEVPAESGAIDADVVADTTPATGGHTLTRREVHHADEVDKHSLERSRHAHTELHLQSRRLDDLGVDRETADLLTADRLLDPAHVVRPEPEGLWQRAVYTATGRRVNLGDSKRARARKDLDARIAVPLVGGATFVPVLSRKGGVGKTTVTTLLGMALADARDDRVIAVDANPDRGTLAERISRRSGKTVRDLVRMRGDVVGFNDLSGIVARDETRLDILASDTDPSIAEAFSDRDYHDVAALAAHYYSIVLTDTGTGIVHSVMDATLELADAIVVVAGLSVDEARLASETLTWLESNGYADLVRRAVVVLNNSRPGAALVRAAELEAHFGTRVRAVVTMPYDSHIAAGSAISFRDLAPRTRTAARELAAALVEGLRD